jgi:methionyl-tRNA formyltransferase
MGAPLKKYILLTEKSWHDSLFTKLQHIVPGEWIHIRSKELFTEATLEEIKPATIFIPHWSYIIPSRIFCNYECILFHMTDLPFGRGGSPLQNLIVSGHSETVISAIKVEEGLDTGDVYLKKKLSLAGKASEIFERASDVIGDMIREIVIKQPTPVPQKGEPIFFKRRKKEDGNIRLLKEPLQVYDYIRMLDCEGYPNSFIETENFRFEFFNAELSSNNEIITAHVRITKK